MPTVTLTQQNFDAVVSENHIVLVDWWADWCGPCRYFAPIYESSAEQHPEIVHGKVDVDAEVTLTKAAQVSAYPTLMAFREGLLVYSEAGVLEGGALEDLVQQIKWLDMDQVRRAMAEQAVGGQQTRAEAPVSAGASSPQAGLAATATRYGWPGL